MVIEGKHGEMNSLMAISLLQDDIIFFGRKDIEMVDGKHVIRQVQVNKDVIDKPEFKIIKENLELIGKCFVDICYYVEKNENIRVKLSRIGHEIRPLLFYDDLTGMTLLNLFAHHLMYFTSPAENKYQIVIHPTLVECVVDIKSLVRELMVTLLSYNDIKPEEVEIQIYDKYEAYHADGDKKE